MRKKKSIRINVKQNKKKIKDGWSYLNSVERFDLESQVWSNVTSMLSARSGFGLVVLNKNLYALGGRDTNDCLNKVERYSPLTNKWYICASMNKKRASVAATALNGFIYAIGGNETITSTNYNIQDSAERFLFFVYFFFLI